MSWIKASTRLPPDGEWVLVFPCPALHDAVFIVGKMIKYDHPSYPWRWEFFNNRTYMCDVFENTYWQPIPASLKVKKNKHMGSTLDSFLEEEGILEQTEEIAFKRTIGCEAVI